MLKRSNTGFTLIELVIVMLIAGILTSFALPAYTKYVTKSRRAAGEACLVIHANYMERFYATNMQYNADSAGTAFNTASLHALALDCASQDNTGKFYRYDLPTVTAAGYQLTATPLASQLTNDTQCGTLTINEKGVRTENGTGTKTDCWAH